MIAQLNLVLAILVNRQRIDEELIRVEAASLKARMQRETPYLDTLTLEVQAREWARENVIRQVLLQQAAGRDSPEQLLKEIQRKVPRPKPGEVAAFYREFPQLFETPELIRAAHIVKNVDEATSEPQAEAAIRQIAEQLHGGADFAKLADRYSDCPGHGGDLGFFARGDMVDEFEAALAPLQPGGVSDVFRSPFGFHIARLLERRPAGRRSLNEARPQIEEQLWNEKRGRATENFIQQLRARAQVVKA